MGGPCRVADSAKLTGPGSTTSENVGGPVKNMGEPSYPTNKTSLCNHVWNSKKSCQKCISGPVKWEKFSRCLSWPSGEDIQHNSRWCCCLETLGPTFETGIQHMKQFAHNWHLPCCQCTDMLTCFLQAKSICWGMPLVKMNHLAVFDCSLEWISVNTLRPRQMDAISQTTFSNAFSWMKMLKFWLKFHWSLFPRVQLTIFQQWFR